MKRLTVGLTVATITFVVGVGFYRAKLTLAVASRPMEPSASNNAEISNDEDYYQIGDDERALGIRHSRMPRSDFSNIFARLNEFVRHEGRKGANTFYVSRIETPDVCKNVRDDACRYVSAYWKEDNSILTIESPFDIEDGTYYEWSYAMRRIDLIKDVVPTWREVGTTNYLIPKSEARKLLNDCKSTGIKIVIQE
jgi:hypothetical protein